jgi:hypothetical protein
MRRKIVANYEAALLRKSIVDNDNQLMKLFPVITVLLYCKSTLVLVQCSELRIGVQV